MDFVTEVYMVTRTYPKHEIFGLSSQTQRAATSIPFNISEGSAKSSDKDFSRYLEMAIGSSFELESAFLVACNLNYITNELLNEKLEKLWELQKMIIAFRNSLN